MNILHLSDIHFGRNYPCYKINNNFAKHDLILEELIEFIGHLDNSLKPKHIVFTGDIVWKGKTEEYSEALIWFKKLLSACNLTGKDISFCVGNHDIDLTYNCLDDEYTDDMVKEIDELYMYENIHKIEPSLNAYNKFCFDLGVEPYTYPLGGKRMYSYSVGFKDVNFSSGKTIRIVSLNTSVLMPQKNISVDKMWLGHEQLKTLMEYGILPAKNDVWYTVALFHHSDRFLHPNEISTYDKRFATFPLLLNCADLLLCGHTESAEKPRLTKQPGGGTILFGGATYYSDDHTNAFSMLYISDRKKTMVFIPYIYENGWQDYDFEKSRWKLKKKRNLPEIGKFYEDIRIVLGIDENEFVIDLKYLEVTKEKDLIRLDNHKDLLNTYRIDTSGSKENFEVKIQISKRGAQSVCGNIEFNKLMQFNNIAGDKRSIRFVNSNQEDIFVSDNFSVEEIHSFDEETLNNMYKIEEYYKVKLTLTDNISDSDYDKINLLLDIAENGYSDKIAFINNDSYVADKEMLENLYCLGNSNNRFCIVSRQPFSVELFGVNIDIFDARLYGGIYYIDVSDIKHKYTTFAEGDMRKYKLQNTEKQIFFISKGDKDNIFEFFSDCNILEIKEDIKVEIKTK